MKAVGYVASEGGPLLVGDCVSLAYWNGIDTDDYQQLIDQLDTIDQLVTINDSSIACWDPEGGGTTWIFLFSDKIVLVRSFDSDAAAYCKQPMKNADYMGEIEIKNGLGVLYATEPGGIMLAAEQGYEGNLTGPDQAFEDGLFLKKSLEGRFSCFADYVYEGETLYSAKRLILERQ